MPAFLLPTALSEAIFSWLFESVFFIYIVMKLRPFFSGTAFSFFVSLFIGVYLFSLTWSSFLFTTLVGFSVFPFPFSFFQSLYFLFKIVFCIFFLSLYLSCFCVSFFSFLIPSLFPFSFLLWSSYLLVFIFSLCLFLFCVSVSVNLLVNVFFSLFPFFPLLCFTSRFSANIHSFFPFLFYIFLY